MSGWTMMKSEVRQGGCSTWPGPTRRSLAHQSTLVRAEFQPCKIVSQSDLRHRVASHWALPQISGLTYDAAGGVSSIL